MKLSHNNIKLIFGLKLKQLRIDKNMSLSELSAKSDLSVSYLNEIESGKKYPKTDKIAGLAEALGTDYDKLVSLKVNKNLAPIGELLNSNILEQLPLDHYGIDINKLIILMSNASLQLSALVATLIEMARGSEMSENNFSRTALRTYKEFNENYFEDLENSVGDFIQDNSLPASQLNFEILSRILIDEYNYKIDQLAMNQYPELNEMRGFAIKGGRNTLLLNRRLSNKQKAFIAGKEIAYNYLNISERSFAHSNMRLNTFDQLLNNFRASYFATALLINRESFIDDLTEFFSANEWNGNYLLSIMEKYNASPEMIFQRITNLTPKFFGLNKFFFLRFNSKLDSDGYNLSKEVRLGIGRNPGGYHSNYHYCRRWISVTLLKQLEEIIHSNEYCGEVVTGIIKSKFHNSDDQFLCISAAKQSLFIPDNIFSVTIGLKLDDDVKQKIKFWDDDNIPFREVNDTCEMCTMTNCAERTAEPKSANELIKRDEVNRALDKLKDMYKD